jgi:hypothetical protein
MTTNNAQRITWTRRDSKACLLAVSAIALLVIAVGGGFRSNPTPKPFTTPTAGIPSYATPEKVQAAMTEQHSCTPTLDAISPRPLISKTLIVYDVGCGRWGYAVLIWGPTKIEANRLPYEWNGQPMNKPGCKRLGGCDNLDGKQL